MSAQVTKVVMSYGVQALVERGGSNQTARQTGRTSSTQTTRSISAARPMTSILNRTFTPGAETEATKPKTRRKDDRPRRRSPRPVRAPLRARGRTANATPTGALTHLKVRYARHPSPRKTMASVVTPSIPIHSTRVTQPSSTHRVARPEPARAAAPRPNWMNASRRRASLAVPDSVPVVIMPVFRPTAASAYSAASVARQTCRFPDDPRGS